MWSVPLTRTIPDVPKSVNTSAHSFVGVVLSRKVESSPENAPASSKFWITSNLLPIPKFIGPFEKSISSPKSWPEPKTWPCTNALPDLKFIGSNLSKWTVAKLAYVTAWAISANSQVEGDAQSIFPLLLPSVNKMSFQSLPAVTAEKSE